MSNRIKVIITGVTGMVGEGVLHECLHSEHVSHILVVGRKSCGITNQKLKEIIHADFHDLKPVEEQLTGYDACFFCLGVTSINKKEEEYYHLTYKLTMNFASTISRLNTGMTFCYISGAATDSTEQGRVMWARVKGKTENDLKKLPFKQVYNFRPGYIQPTKGLRNTHGFYQYIQWMYPVFKLTLSKYVCTLQELGTAMINASLKGYHKQELEVKDIVELAKVQP